MFFRYKDTRILVVDDNSVNREIVRELLATLGIAVIEAVNGQEAVEQVTSRGAGYFAAVFLDLQMPVMDGFGAARAIREQKQYAQLPLIAMTAFELTDERSSLIRLGIDAFLIKPFSDKALYGIVERWVDPAKRCSPGDSLAPAVAAGFPRADGIDFCAGLARFAGNSTRYRHWLALFAQEAPEIITEISRGCANGPGKEASKLLHALKGRAGMLGLTRLHSATLSLEEAMTLDTAALTARLANLSRLIEETRTQLLLIEEDHSAVSI